MDSLYGMYRVIEAAEQYCMREARRKGQHRAGSRISGSWCAEGQSMYRGEEQRSGLEGSENCAIIFLKGDDWQYFTLAS